MEPRHLEREAENLTAQREADGAPDDDETWV
jgi:hypothetical protein